MPQKETVMREVGLTCRAGLALPVLKWRGKSVGRQRGDDAGIWRRGARHLLRAAGHCRRAETTGGGKSFERRNLATMGPMALRMARHEPAGQRVRDP